MEVTNKHEWRKAEKQFYNPKTKPEIVEIPEFNFITISGEGNPNEQEFVDCVTCLYSVAYAIKMTIKKIVDKPTGYKDFTVYPLEGVWDIKVEARKNFASNINKEDLVYNLMIRQPEFVDEGFFKEMLEMTKKKKKTNPSQNLDKVKFEKINEGKCVQMLHIGSFDDEPASFAIMEKFAKLSNLKRKSKVHREIYLSDFRRVAKEKLKTILRFKVV